MDCQQPGRIIYPRRGGLLLGLMEVLPAITCQNRLAGRWGHSAAALARAKGRSDHRRSTAIWRLRDLPRGPSSDYPVVLDYC